MPKETVEEKQIRLYGMTDTQAIKLIKDRWAMMNEKGLNLRDISDDWLEWILEEAKHDSVLLSLGNPEMKKFQLEMLKVEGKAKQEGGI